MGRTERCIEKERLVFVLLELLFHSVPESKAQVLLFQHDISVLDDRRLFPTTHVPWLLQAERLMLVIDDVRPVSPGCIEGEGAGEPELVSEPSL